MLGQNADLCNPKNMIIKLQDLLLPKHLSFHCHSIYKQIYGYPTHGGPTACVTGSLSPSLLLCSESQRASCPISTQMYRVVQWWYILLHFLPHLCLSIQFNNVLCHVPVFFLVFHSTNELTGVVDKIIVVKFITLTHMFLIQYFSPALWF